MRFLRNISISLKYPTVLMISSLAKHHSLHSDHFMWGGGGGGGGGKAELNSMCLLSDVCNECNELTSPFERQNSLPCNSAFIISSRMQHFSSWWYQMTSSPIIKTNPFPRTPAYVPKLLLLSLYGWESFPCSLWGQGGNGWFLMAVLQRTLLWPFYHNIYISLCSSLVMLRGHMF